jgi:di/tricarboxylate transporter
MSRLGSRTTRAILIVVIFALAVGVWSTRPLHESLHVGTDWTPTLLVPPQAAKEVHVKVECNNLYASSPQSDTPLPALTPQPADKPPLAYPREPCVFVHGDARRAFAIDILVVVAALAALAYLKRRAHRIHATPQTGTLEHEDVVSS